jgi:hypothetical protein
LQVIDRDGVERNALDRRQRIWDRIAGAEAAVKSGEIEPWVFQILGAFPNALARILPSLLEVSRQHGFERQMLDGLLAPDARTWSSAILVTRIGCGLLDNPHFDNFSNMVRDRIANISTFEFAQYDYLPYQPYAMLDKRLRPLILEFKYVGLPNPVSADNIFESAELVSKRIVFHQPPLDFLFKNRSQRKMSRTAWEHEVRMAWALDHLIRDLALSIPKRMEMVEAGARSRVLKAFKKPSADIVAYHHAGFYPFISFMPDVFPGAYIIGGISGLTVNGDTSGPIVHGLRHALRGGMVGISPDGIVGKGTKEISVLGRKVMIKPGAAFMAYESRARTSFFTMGRRGASFVPIIKFGPVRKQRESYSAYLERYTRFYESCLNDFFSMSPQHLVFGGLWGSMFNEPSQPEKTQ